MYKTTKHDEKKLIGESRCGICMANKSFYDGINHHHYCVSISNILNLIKQNMLI